MADGWMDGWMGGLMRLQEEGKCECGKWERHVCMYVCNRSIRSIDDWLDGLMV